MRAAALLVVLAACGTSSADDDGYYYSVHVSSPFAFDRLDIHITSGSRPAAAILTPGLLASGQPATEGDVFVREHEWVDEIAKYGDATTDDTIDGWDISDEFAEAIVVARRGTTVIGGGENGLSYAYRDGAFHGDASLAMTTDAEVWGVEGDCVRIGSTYLVHLYYGQADSDCDGMPDYADCKPYAYCDPSSTDPAFVAACTCP